MRLFCSLAVMFLLVLSLVTAPNHELPPDFSQQPTLDNFQALENPTQEQFTQLSVADQATYLQSNYRDDFAIEFYRLPEHVGQYPEIDRQYFSKIENHNLNPSSSEKFFLGASARENIRLLQNPEAASSYFSTTFGASYTITSINDDFAYLPEQGILRNAGVDVHVDLFLGHSDVAITTTTENTIIAIAGKKVSLHSQGQNLALLSFDAASGFLQLEQGTLILPDEGAELSLQQDGTLRLKGNGLSGSFSRGNVQGSYTIKGGILTIDAAGNVLQADNAELDTPSLYVQGRFSSNGKEWKLYDHDGEHSWLAYKGTSEDGSIPVFASQGQARDREALTVYVNEVSPNTLYRKASPTQEQVQRAVAERRTVPLQPGEGKAWIQHDGARTQIYLAGNVQFSYQHTAQGKPVGKDTSLPSMTGENEFSTFDFMKEGEVEQFQQQGKGTYGDAHLSSQLVDDGSTLTKLPGRPESADVLSTACVPRGTSTCSTGSSFGIIQKKMAVVGNAERVAGREVFMGSEPLSYAIHLENTETGVVPLHDAVSAGALARALEREGTSLAFQKELFIASGTGDERHYLGISGKGIGRYEHRGENLELTETAGVDFRLRKIAGNQLFLVDGAEQQELERITSALQNKRFSELGSISGLSPGVAKRVEREFGFNPSLMDDPLYAEKVIAGFTALSGEQNSVETWAKLVQNDLQLDDSQIDSLGNCLTEQCAGKMNAVLTRGDAAAQRILTLQIRKKQAEIGFAEAELVAGEEEQNDVRQLRKEITALRNAKDSANRNYEQIIRAPCPALVGSAAGNCFTTTPQDIAETAERIARRDINGQEMGVLDEAWKKGKVKRQLEQDIHNLVAQRDAEMASFNTADERHFWESPTAWQNDHRRNHQAVVDRMTREIQGAEEKLRSALNPAETEVLLVRLAERPDLQAVVMQHLDDHQSSAVLLQNAQHLLDGQNMRTDRLQLERAKARVRAGADTHVVQSDISSIQDEALRGEAEAYLTDRRILSPLRQVRAGIQRELMQKEDEVRLREGLEGTGFGRAMSVLNNLNPYQAGVGIAEATGQRTSREEQDEQFMEQSGERLDFYDTALAQLKNNPDAESFLASLEGNSQARNLGIGAEVDMFSRQARGLATDSSIQAQVEVEQIRRQMDLHRDAPTQYQERLRDLVSSHPDSGASLALEIANYREENLARDEVVTAAFDIAEIAVGVGLSDVLLSQGAKLAARSVRGAVNFAVRGTKATDNFLKSIRRVDQLDFLPLVQPPLARAGCAIAGFGCALPTIAIDVAAVERAEQAMGRARLLAQGDVAGEAARLHALERPLTAGEHRAVEFADDVLAGDTIPDLPAVRSADSLIDEQTATLVVRRPEFPDQFDADELLKRYETIIKNAEDPEQLEILLRVMRSEGAVKAFRKAGREADVQGLEIDLVVKRMKLRDDARPRVYNEPNPENFARVMYVSDMNKESGKDFIPFGSDDVILTPQNLRASSRPVDEGFVQVVLRYNGKADRLEIVPSDSTVTERVAKMHDGDVVVTALMDEKGVVNSGLSWVVKDGKFSDEVPQFGGKGLTTYNKKIVRYNDALKPSPLRNNLIGIQDGSGLADDYINAWARARNPKHAGATRVRTYEQYLRDRYPASADEILARADPEKLRQLDVVVADYNKIPVLERIYKGDTFAQRSADLIRGERSPSACPSGAIAGLAACLPQRDVTVVLPPERDIFSLVDELGGAEVHRTPEGFRGENVDADLFELRPDGSVLREGVELTPDASSIVQRAVYETSFPVRSLGDAPAGGIEDIVEGGVARSDTRFPVRSLRAEQAQRIDEIVRHLDESGGVKAPTDVRLPFSSPKSSRLLMTDDVVKTAQLRPPLAGQPVEYSLPTYLKKKTRKFLDQQGFVFGVGDGALITQHLGKKLPKGSSMEKIVKTSHQGSVVEDVGLFEPSAFLRHHPQTGATEWWFLKVGIDDAFNGKIETTMRDTVRRHKSMERISQEEFGLFGPKTEQLITPEGLTIQASPVVDGYTSIGKGNGIKRLEEMVSSQQGLPLETLQQEADIHTVLNTWMRAGDVELGVGKGKDGQWHVTRIDDELVGVSFDLGTRQYTPFHSFVPTRFVNPNTPYVMSNDIVYGVFKRDDFVKKLPDGTEAFDYGRFRERYGPGIKKAKKLANTPEGTARLRQHFKDSGYSEIEASNFVKNLQNTADTLEDDLQVLIKNDGRAAISPDGRLMSEQKFLDEEAKSIAQKKARARASAASAGETAPLPPPEKLWRRILNKLNPFASQKTPERTRVTEPERAPETVPGRPAVMGNTVNGLLLDDFVNTQMVEAAS